MDREHPMIEAHRGDSAKAPENTIAAFRRAVELGVPWIELDVHPSRDGVLMVLHDDTVDRTTNGAGPVCRLTAGELQHLDAGSWFDPRFADERIPMLSEVFDLVAPTRTNLNVEIKASPRGTDVPHAIVALLQRFGKTRNTVISSFDVSTLLRIRHVDPQVSLALIGDAPHILRQAVEHHLPWIHGRHPTVTAALIEEAHAHAIRVSAWTVDDPKTILAWKRSGLDKLCTNCPARFLSRTA